MKKSEMVNVIMVSILRMILVDDLRGEAEEILKGIEKAGMLPPFEDQSSIPEGDYFTLHVDGARYPGKCEWEPEDE